MTKLNGWKENGDVKLPELKKENGKNENIKILSKNEIENIINDKSLSWCEKILKTYGYYLNKENFENLKKVLNEIKLFALNEYKYNIEDLLNNDNNILGLWCKTLLGIKINFEYYEDLFKRLGDATIKIHKYLIEQGEDRIEIPSTAGKITERKAYYDKYPMKKFSLDFFVDGFNNTRCLRLEYNKQNFNLYNSLIDGTILNNKNLLSDILSLMDGSICLNELNDTFYTFTEEELKEYFMFSEDFKKLEKFNRKIEKRSEQYGHEYKYGKYSNCIQILYYHDEDDN